MEVPLRQKKFVLLLFLVPLVLWWISFLILPRTPSDSVFSAGPALGLLREGILVDNLSWDNFPVYLGHPPAYFLYEIPFLSVFGASLSTIYLIIFSLVLLYAFSLFVLLRKTTNDFFRIGFVTLLAVCSNYVVSGRVDILAIVLLTAMMSVTRELVRQPGYLRGMLAGFLMALCFLTHPLAGALASIVFSLDYFINNPNKKFTYYFVSGLTAFLIVSFFYVPYVYFNLETFRDHFLTMATGGQNHFYYPNLLKFVSYNLGFFGLLSWILINTPWRTLSPDAKKWLIIAAASTGTIFIFGMSYYYLYCQPVFCLLIVVLWEGLPEEKFNSFLSKGAMVLFVIVGLFQGPVSIILQSLRNPEYARELRKVKKDFKELAARYPDYKIVADGNLVVEILENPKARYFWHSFDHFRSPEYLNAKVIFAFTEDETWKDNVRLIGDWADSTRYETLYFRKGVHGLSSSYFLKKSGSDLNFWFVRAKPR